MQVKWAKSNAQIKWKVTHSFSELCPPVLAQGEAFASDNAQHSIFQFGSASGSNNHNSFGVASSTGTYNHILYYFWNTKRFCSGLTR